MHGMYGKLCIYVNWKEQMAHFLAHFNWVLVSKFCQSKSLSRPPPDTWRGPYPGHPGPAAEDTWNQQESTSCDSFCRTEILRFWDVPFDKIRRTFDVESLAVQGHHPNSHLHEEVRAPWENGRWKMAWRFQLMCKLFRSHVALATRSTGAKWSWRRQHCGDAGSQNTKLWYFLPLFSRGFLLFLLCKESELSFGSERLL